jgi:hypothetical protein
MMKGGLGNLMKQAQQMQENMKKAQEELARTEVEGQAGAGLVKVAITCNFAVKKVTIDPALSARTRTCSRTSSWRDERRRRQGPGGHAGEDVRLHRGLNLPPGMGLPF